MWRPRGSSLLHGGDGDGGIHRSSSNSDAGGIASNDTDYDDADSSRRRRRSSSDTGASPAVRKARQLLAMGIITDDEFKQLVERDARFYEEENRAAEEAVAAAAAADPAPLTCSRVKEL